MPRPEGNPRNKGGGRKGYAYEQNKNRALTGLWRKVADKIEAGEELTEMEEKWVAPLLSKTIKQEIDSNVKVEEINLEPEQAKRIAKEQLNEIHEDTTTSDTEE